ncbi:MAG TPA: GDP-mannose 4,6-dehydratase, partial [Candidatus Binatia bacterium]|nr:GDP-mannose 4,6-dehydratase [Candidatus Binatia bacterium]
MGSGKGKGKGNTGANGAGNGNGHAKGNGNGNKPEPIFPLPLRVLITGGAGFIGSHLAEHLVARGAAVTAIDDLSTGSFANIAHLAERNDFRFVCESVTNETVMDRLVSHCDIIYHLAAAVGVDLIIKNPVQTIETNVLGTEAVLRLARRAQDAVIVFLVGMIVALAVDLGCRGKSANHPYKEDDDRV